MTPDQLFAPPGVEWQRLAPAWRTVRRINALIGYLLVFGIATAVVYRFLDWRWALPVAILGLVITIWRYFRIGTLYRSWGYAELADDLYLTRGVTFRNLTAVPYARMQVVEVESGPIERAFGLATVKLVTASAGTDAAIPGLPPDRAAELRDRLTSRAENGNSGL